MQQKIQAPSTHRPDNRFRIKLFWQLTGEGLIIPLLPKYKKKATHTIELVLEYLSYEKDLDLKRSHRTYDSNHQVHYLEYDSLQADLVAFCLVDWNIPEVLPELNVGKIQRQNNRLIDKSWEDWKHLPPIIRKHISNTIARHMGY